jgi:hypothetical protein
MKKNLFHFLTAADCLILSQISVISLTAVSAPREKSVPGTLLLKKSSDLRSGAHLNGLTIPGDLLRNLRRSILEEEEA